MEEVLNFLDLSSHSWVFLWDQQQEKVVSTGQEALESWSWSHKQGQLAKNWRLMKPFRAGILQSAWALDQSLAHYFSQEGLKNKTALQLLSVLLASANTEAERTKVKQLVGQHSLRRVKIEARVDVFADYLSREKDFSELKLIIDCHSDFIELAIFLGQECLKSKHFLLPEKLDPSILTENLVLALDVFLLNLPRQLFAKRWQYFYLFLDSNLKTKPHFDQLNRHLSMEAIVFQEQLNYFFKK